MTNKGVATFEIWRYLTDDYGGHVDIWWRYPDGHGQGWTLGGVPEDHPSYGYSAQLVHRSELTVDQVDAMLRKLRWLRKRLKGNKG